MMCPGSWSRRRNLNDPQDLSKSFWKSPARQRIVCNHDVTVSGKLREGRNMEDIRQALATLQSARDHARRELTRLDAAIRALQGVAAGSSARPKRTAPKARRKLSAAARKKIAAAQRARWAKIKKQKSSTE